MNWTTFWTALVTSLGSSAAFIGFAVWIGKTWLGSRIEKSVQHEYDKKLETHRAELQRSYMEAVKMIEAERLGELGQQAVDRKLFEAFLAELPSDGSITFIREFNFAGFPFKRNSLDDLQEFLHDWDDPEHEFLDADLEKLRKALHAHISDLLGLLAANTWPTDLGEDHSWVPPEWEMKQPHRFKEVVDAIHDKCSRIVQVHGDLVRLGRRMLLANSA